MAPKKMSLHEKLKLSSPPPLEPKEATEWRARRWRSHVNAEDLPRLVREGDIILFLGNEVQEGCLRCATRRLYNHCGLVVRNVPPHGVQTFILESTINGVCFCPLLYYVEASQWADVNKRFRRLYLDGKRLASHWEKRVDSTSASSA